MDHCLRAEEGDLVMETEEMRDRRGYFSSKHCFERSSVKSQEARVLMIR